MNRPVQRHRTASPVAAALAGAIVQAAIGLASALPAHAGAATAGAPTVSAPTQATAPATPQPHGVQVPDEPTLSAAQLCSQARKGDAEALNQLAWVYAYGKGVERNESYASYLFFAASNLGHNGARRMLRNLSWPAAQVPPCLDEPEPEPPPAAAAPAPAPQPPIVKIDAPPHIAKVVNTLAPQYGLDPLLVLAVISVESNFDVFALSPKNAMGLMQLIPETTERFGVRKPFDVRENIKGGMAYLRWLLAYFEGDLSLVAAAYNAGEGAVEKHRGIPPFAETQDYVRKVLLRFGTGQHPFDAKVTRPSPTLRLIGKTAKAS